MLAPHFLSLSPSFFSSLHPSPCTQTPPLKHNDNNTPAASACRACVSALARCLPACCCWQLPLRLPSLPVGRTANGNGTARHGKRRGSLLPANSAVPSSVPGELALGAARQAPTLFTPQRQFTPQRRQLRRGEGNKSQPTNLVCCDCFGGVGRVAAWGELAGEARTRPRRARRGTLDAARSCGGAGGCPARGLRDAVARSLGAGGSASFAQLFLGSG